MASKTIRELEKMGYPKGAPSYAAGSRGLAPVHPGLSIYENVVKASDITVTAFAQRLHISRRSASDLLNCKANITANIALRLEAIINIEAAYWMRLQANDDLSTEKATFAKRKLKFAPLPAMALAG